MKNVLKIQTQLGISGGWKTAAPLPLGEHQNWWVSRGCEQGQVNPTFQLETFIPFLIDFSTYNWMALKPFTFL